MNSILVVGDLHGCWGRLNTLINKKKPEIILQCGDFGYWPTFSLKKHVIYGYREKPWAYYGIRAQGTKIYWCDGNHEDHWRLRDEDYQRVIPADYSTIKHMPRGSVLTLPDGRNVLFIGGAESVDKDERMLGVDWFPEECISLKDYQKCCELQIKIDIVISHTCPIEFEMKKQTLKQQDPSRVALSGILEKFKPDLWYFGHWHLYKKGTYGNTRWTCLNHTDSQDVWWKVLDA